MASTQKPLRHCAEGSQQMIDKLRQWYQPARISSCQCPPRKAGDGLNLPRAQALHSRLVARGSPSDRYITAWAANEQ